jgi:3-methylfumaryl-CoA hydratase
MYREPAPQNRAPAATAREGKRAREAAPCQASRVIRPSEALLFRYSALTFNTHRIHYDKPYATQEEGYAGVVVQGPLTATLLLDLARREIGDNALADFAFRGISPAIAGDELLLSMTVTGVDMDFVASTAEGRPVMTARGGMKTDGQAGQI